MDKKHLNNLSLSIRSEISILALVSEHKDLSLVPSATTESQVPAESGSLVTSNLRWPQNYRNMRVWVKTEAAFFVLVWFGCWLFGWVFF